MHSIQEKSVISQIPGRVIHLNENLDVPVCTPEFRKSNGSYLKRRGLLLLNRFLQKGCFETIGSPWFPGFWMLSRAQALEFNVDQKLNDSSLNLVVTHEPMNDDRWFSFKGEPFMVVENEWSSFEQYADTMKKKYRARLKKAMRLEEQVDIRVLDEEHYSSCAMLLERTLMDKVVVLPRNLESLLQRYKEVFSEKFVLHGFFVQDELVGFISTVEDGQTLRAMHYGAGEAAPEGMYSLAMFHVIRYGIGLGLQHINLGRTATEIKSTYGAVAHENYFSFFTGNRFFRILLKIASKRYKAKEYVLRSPFKS